MGRALWRELVIGFASQLGELRLGFTQLAALYVLADGSTLTIGELAESINRSPSATSRLIDGLVKRRLVERRSEEEDRRQKVLRLTPRGHAILRVVDRGRAEQFLAAVRPLPTAERSIVAMGVAALATHAISRRGRLIRATPGTGYVKRPEGLEVDRCPLWTARSGRYSGRAPPQRRQWLDLEPVAHEAHDSAGFDEEREWDAGMSSPARPARRPSASRCPAASPARARPTDGRRPDTAR